MSSGENPTAAPVATEHQQREPPTDAAERNHADTRNGNSGAEYPTEETPVEPFAAVGTSSVRAVDGEESTKAADGQEKRDAPTTASTHNSSVGSRPIGRAVTTEGRVADAADKDGEGSTDEKPKPATRRIAPLAASTSTASTDSTKAATGAPCPPTPAPAPAPAAPPGPPIPDVLVFRKSPDGDDFGFRAVLEAVTNPQMFTWTRFALRVVAFVSFPMFTIAVHPNTMTALGFPQMLIASVIASSTCRPTLGEQIGLHSWTWRGITFMLVMGVVFDSWNIAKHVHAWWGLIAMSIFLAGLCTHGGMRRFMFLYIFVYMMELRMFELYFGAVPVNNAAWMAADLYMGTLFGIAALCFPYPVLTSQLIDMLMGKIFEGMSKMLMAMQSFLVSPMVHAAVAFYDDASPFQKMEYVLSVMAPLLWFTNWEPWEFPTRNPVRRLKLSLFRRIMALTYAAFSIGKEVAVLRREQADRIEMQRIRMEIWLQAHQGENGGGATAPADEEERAAQQRKMAHGAEAAESRFFTKMKETYGDDRAEEVEAKFKTLRANTNEHYKAFTATLTQAINLVGSVKNTPESLVKEVPFQALAEKEVEFHRNRRLEVLQLLNAQYHLVASRRQRKQQQKKQQQQQQQHKHSGHEDKLVSNLSMTTHYAMEKEDAMEILDYQDVVDDMGVYLGFQEMFFAMLLSMIAGELISFGEMMAEYKPEKPLCRRLFEYFLVEPWNDFWSALWSLVHLDTPSDIRTIKDAIKMTSAFLAACAFNFEIWVPTGGMYFFGTTILLGLPIEEESIGIGVCRMAGNTLGCALGYLAYHNTKNLSEMIGLIMSFSFVCHLARNHPVFGQCFFYAGFICMAGMATSINTLELLVRVLASTYTVMAYTLCCMFVFPSNPIKILWGYRMKISKAISETIDDVAITTRLPLLDDLRNDRDEHSPYGIGNRLEDGEHGELLAVTMRSIGRNDNGVDHMLAALNMQVSLVDRLQAMCTKWTPLAEPYPVIRGMLPYPRIPSLQVHGAQTKMVASLRLLVFGVQLVHRPRSQPADPALKRLFSSSVADFLDDFSNAVRLIFQNFIDSLQTSRTWSYPVSLVYHGVLMKLRVRLRAILFESFVLIGIPGGRNTLEVGDDELRDLMRDTSQRMQADEDHLHPHDRTSVLVEGNASPQGGATPSSPLRGATRTGGGGGGGGGREASGTFANNNGSFGANPNASFAGRYLLARLAMEEYQQQNSENPQEHNNEPTPRTMEDLKNSVTLHNAVTNLSMTLGSGGGSRAAYQHRARFEEAQTQPNDMFPFHPEDPNRQLGIHMRHTKEAEESSPPRSHHHSSTAPSRRSSLHSHHSSLAAGDNSLPPPQQQQLPLADDRTHQPDYLADGGERFDPVKPKKTPSKLATAVSRLVRQHEQPDMIPKYQGPGFSYREDMLDLPVDTDFLALVAILSSCGTLMDDIQSLAGPVNNISGWQKQLHESSLCLSLIDKLSDCTKQTRKENYERYHYPPPPPEKRSHLNAQEDVWHRWRF